MCIQNDREEKRMYTYDDYQKKKQEYGFTPDQISDADDRLAQYNPDAGMALLGYKNDWLTASNDSAKAMAHAAAEDIRSRYGNYSGGGNGGSFTPTGTAQYEDPWETAVQSTIKNMQNRKFEWSPETDPSAKYYTDMYRREGERAMKDTLGTVAATTGGIPSSYATAAAAQQRNYYAQALTDKYPELYQQAFDRFMQEYDNEYKMLDAYMRLGDTDYTRWSDQQERNRNARLDAAAAQQQAFENQVTTEELAIQQEQAQIMKQEMDLELKRFDYEQRRDAEEMAWRWADLIQQGNIEQAKLEYQNSALELEAKDIAMKYAYQYAELDYQKDVLAEESRQSDLDREQQMIIALIEEELARDQLAADKDQAYNDILRAIISSGGNMSALAELEALDFDTEQLREQVIQQIMGQTSGTQVVPGDEVDPNVFISVLDKVSKGQELTDEEQNIYDRWIMRLGEKIMK